MAPHNDRLIIRSAWISLAVSVVVLVVKFYAYLQTHSTAVLSDASESIVNVLAAFVALFVLRAVAQPADEEHPYGHGKLEYFSAAFEGGLISFAALVIAYGAIHSFIVGSRLNLIESGLVLLIGATVINFLLYLHLYSVGKSKKSEALIASSKHILSDVVTSVGVILGLGLVKLTGKLWIDDVVALIVALLLLKEGYRIVRRAIGGLIDEVDVESLRDFAGLFGKLRKPGMIDVHQMKLIRSGRFHHIDAHLVVPEFWDVARAHMTNDEFESSLADAYPFDCEIAFHLDPCNRAYCKNCDLSDCQVRRHAFQQAIPFSAKTLVRLPEFNEQGDAKL